MKWKYVACGNVLALDMLEFKFSCWCSEILFLCEYNINLHVAATTCECYNSNLHDEVSKILNSKLYIFGNLHYKPINNTCCIWGNMKLYFLVIISLWHARFYVNVLYSKMFKFSEISFSNAYNSI